jgi:hydrogenase maturation protease
VTRTGGGAPPLQAAGRPHFGKTRAVWHRLARTVLYEGYNLYPYRPTALKNRYRWSFGALPPCGTREVREEGMSWFNQTECLVRSPADGGTVEVLVRFLQLVAGEGGGDTGGWAHAVEREVSAGSIALARRNAADGGADEVCELAFEGGLRGRVLTRVTPLQASDRGRVWRVRVRLENLSPVLPDGEVLLCAFHAAHTVLHVPGGEAISAQDPPEALRWPSAACENLGLWPVLLGPDLVMAAPLILADHPQLAPESPGDLFDATEIDEILALRIQTMTDEERALAAASDPRTRELLERTLGLGGPALQALHGRLVSSAPVPEDLVGSRVRLRPRARADALDAVLSGRHATVRAVERDQLGTAFVAVTIDDDPGVDLGQDGFPGHRFFYRLDEIEAAPARPRVLVAGVGNIVHADDAFGVHVAQHLLTGPVPEGVRVVDFGIRSFDLACALMDGLDGLVLLDVLDRGGAPGTLFVLEPELPTGGGPITVEAHTLDPASVLGYCRALGTSVPWVRVVGCQPAVLRDDEQEVKVGLSAAVAEAVRPAARLAMELAASRLSEVSRA